ncbi:MAG TPA: VOC family protein [Devosiaceae bacterium]|jgi:catechol 2,3-dioxygenase-like lactoylglutathione lyase family enzyme
MQFNHVNLTVTEVAAAADFFTAHFDFAAVGQTRDNFIMLEGEGGFVLTLMTAGRAGPSPYPRNFHIGFFVATVAAVNAKHEELVQAGRTPGDVQEFRRAAA